MIHTKFTLISYMFSYIECVTHTHIHKIHLGYHKEKNVLTKKNKVKGYHQLNVYTILNCVHKSMLGSKKKSGSGKGNGIRWHHTKTMYNIINIMSEIV